MYAVLAHAVLVYVVLADTVLVYAVLAHAALVHAFLPFHFWKDFSMLALPDFWAGTA